MRLERRGILCTRPNHDVATRIMSKYWKELVLDLALKNNIYVIDLEGENAVKSKFNAGIKSADPILVCGVGHGNDKAYTGQRLDILLQKGRKEDAKLMKGRIGSFLSCIFGKSGPWWVSNDMRVFFGYKEEFIFSICGNNDEGGCGKPFAEGKMAFDISLLQGETIYQAWNRSITAWNEAISKGDPYTVRYLIHDRDCQVLYLRNESDVDWSPFPSTPTPPQFSCPFCEESFRTKESLLGHICGAHCEPTSPKYGVCLLPSWIRRLIGCRPGRE